MYTGKYICRFLVVVAFVFAASPASADVVLQPTHGTWLYGYANCQQGSSDSGYYGQDVTVEDEWVFSTDPPENPSAYAEYDPIDSTDPADPLYDPDNLSSFAVGSVSLTDLNGWVSPGGSDSFQLRVNNQATQDPQNGDPPVPLGEEGWGDSAAYLFITYNTIASNGSNPGDPMTVTVNLNLSEVLYAQNYTYYPGGEEYADEAFLEVGYSLGTGLILDQFDRYQSWYAMGPDNLQQVEFSDSLVYSGVIGDQVQLLVVIASYSYSYFGYAWTEAALNQTQSMLSASIMQDSPQNATLKMTVTAGTLPVDIDGDGFNKNIDCNDNDPNINPGAAEVCGDGVDNDCDGKSEEGCVEGDVNGDGNITPQDALMAFLHYLELIQLDAPRQDQADVNNDGFITPADALCIFRKYLKLDSCLD